MTPKPGPSIPDNWQERFLAVLAKSANVSKAARAAGVSRNFVYEQYKADATFTAAWDDALEQACDALEAEAWRRGHDGVNEPVYQGGKRVGYLRRYSDGLLVKLLQAHRPGKFRDTSRHELTGKDGAPLIPDPPAPLSLAELRQMVSVLAQAGALDDPADVDA